MPNANAALLARRLEIRHRVRRHARHPALWLSVAGLIAAIAAAARVAPVAGVRELLDTALAHPERSFGLIAILAGLRALRLRRAWLSERAHGWLGALPIAPAQAARADALRLAGAQLAVLAVMLAGLALAAVASGSARGAPALAALSGGGVLCGSLAGGLLGRRPARPRARRSLRASARIGRTASGWRVLAGWPLRQTRAQADPGVHARLIGALLLAMPLGVSMMDVLRILMALVGVLAAAEYLRGQLVVIAASGGWLRSAALAPRHLAATLITPSLAVLAGIAAGIGLVLVGTFLALAAIALAGGAILAAWHFQDPTRPAR